MVRLAAVCCSVLLIAACATGQGAMTLHVAPTGNDAAAGTAEAPFATLAHARDAVRAALARGGAPVTVMLHAGVYELTETLSLGRDDGGTDQAPVTWRAAEGEAVTIRGGRAVTGWEVWRDGIYRADLKAQGLAGARFHQLCYEGHRQILARHPNVDAAHPRTGGFAYVEARGDRPSEQFIYEAGSLPFEQWGDISQAEISTTYGLGWNFAITPVSEVDRERRQITVRAVRRPFEPNNRFIVQNVLGALDAPGEWFCDQATDTLYFRPPHDGPPRGEVVVPLVDHLIEARGTIPYPHGYLNVAYRGAREDFAMPPDAPPDAPVRGLVFLGLHLEVARQDGLRLVGAEGCRVVGCTVTNVGGIGINLGGAGSFHEEVGNPRLTPNDGAPSGVGGGGQNLLFHDPCRNCTVTGCDVAEVGSDGIFLYGTGNLAENNQVHDSGLFDKDCACINLFGERNVARRNTLHDVPRNAVFLKGIDNVVELNDIHHTMLETCDGGAIRMCQRNLTIRGNTIRGNRIVDTLGYGYPRGSRAFQAPYFSWGVYLDDFTCGTTVSGNLIVRTGRGGIHVHGGSDNVVEGNIVVDAGQYEYENNPIRADAATGNQVRRNVFAFDGAKTMLYRCGQWHGTEQATWESNLVWPQGGPVRVGLGQDTVEGWDAWLVVGAETGSVVADPGFADAAHDDYRLAADSPARKLGIEDLPLDQVGCYQAAERASWPLDDDPARVREEPFLHVAPVPPLAEDFEHDPANRPPREGDVSDTPQASIRVTAELGAGGSKQCLKFVDAAGQPNPWQPRIYWPLHHDDGTVRFALALRLDGATPPTLGIDLRQYTDTGGGEYLSGPFLAVNAQGELAAARQVLGKLPFDTWITLAMVMTLGDAANGKYTLTVTPDGGQPQTHELPCVSEGFKRLERVVVMATGDGPGVFWLDDVGCRPVP